MTPVVSLIRVFEQSNADFDQHKKQVVNVVTNSLERDLERLKADHATEIQEMVKRHTQEVSELKNKQWVSPRFNLKMSKQIRVWLKCFTVYFGNKKVISLDLLH